MAVATYNTDLGTISLCEAGQSYIEFVGYAWGDGGAVETDWYLQGGACASDEANGKTGVGHSIGVDYGSLVTFDTGDCLFAWMQCQAGNAMDIYANGGYRILMGSSTSVFYGWYVGGSDYGRNPYGGWTNVVADPTATAQDTGNGSPTTWQFFGVGFVLVSAIGKGRPINADAMRWGRGDLYVEAGEAAAYGTFVGMALANDDSAARWGLFQGVAGGYLWKGLISLGTTNAVDFRDSNRNITIDDTPRTYADFNKIEINHADSYVEWTGISIASSIPTGLSIGDLVVNADAEILFDTCTFTDMNSFTFNATSTSADIINTTFRRCGLVTQAGATFDGCTFDKPTGTYGFKVTDLNIVDNCVFNSDGTGYAMELDSSMAGNSYTMSGCSFVGYADIDGDTGNECIYNNTGGTVTIAVGTGQIPTFHDDGTSNTIITASVPVYIIVKDTNGNVIQDVQTAIYKTSDRTQIVNQDTDGDGEVDTSYSGSTPVAVEVRCRKSSSGATKYKNYSSLQTIASVTGLLLSVTLIEDPNNNAET